MTLTGTPARGGSRIPITFEDERLKEAGMYCLILGRITSAFPVMN